MYWLRKWSVRHARLLEATYDVVERGLVFAAPVMRRVGYERLEKPVAIVEKAIKGALFDCQMCGQCVLSSTGMACPMNCPKGIRNGPCGGVRAEGYCEVKPEMRCVWVEAWEGAGRMKRGDDISVVQFAVDHRLKGRSSWLRVVRMKNETVAPGSVTTVPATDKSVTTEPATDKTVTDKTVTDKAETDKAETDMDRKLPS